MYICFPPYFPLSTTSGMFSNLIRASRIRFETKSSWTNFSSRIHSKSMEEKLSDQHPSIYSIYSARDSTRSIKVNEKEMEDPWFARTIATLASLITRSVDQFFHVGTRHPLVPVFDHTRVPVQLNTS